MGRGVLNINGDWLPFVQGQGGTLHAKRRSVTNASEKDIHRLKGKREAEWAVGLSGEGKREK